MDFYISVLNFICITMIGVSGVFIVTGMTGYLSLGQSAFMATGAYAAAIFATKLGMPFVVCVLAAMVIGSLAGLLISLPAIKLRRDYITLITFGFSEAILALMVSLPTITGGAMGYSGIPKMTSTPLLVCSAVLACFLVFQFKYSKFGRECLSLKTDELAAKSIGINVAATKLRVFVLSAALTSYAGALYAFHMQYIDPTMFTWSLSAEWVIIVFVGGMNSFSGAIFSTFALMALPELLRFANSWRIVIYSVLVLLILNFRPRGIFGEFELYIPKRMRQLKKGGTVK